MRASLRVDSGLGKRVFGLPLPADAVR